MSEPQNMMALRRANEIRMHAAQVKREIRAVGASRAVEALADPTLANVDVRVILKAQPRWGTARAVRCLSRLGVRDTTIGALTLRERGALAVFLGMPHLVDKHCVWVLRAGDLIPVEPGYGVKVRVAA